MSKQIVLTGLLLLAFILLCERFEIDLWLQDAFYDFERGRWILNGDNFVLDLLLYSGIKKLFILLILLLVGGLVFFRKALFIQRHRPGLIIVCLSAILVPALVGGLKAVSNTPCPKHLKRYGGRYPYVTVLSSYPAGFQQKRSVKCYPAGHASGGFSLFSTLFLFKRRRQKASAFVLVLLIGWSTGLYKMLIGDHFFSHTVVTMLLAWMIVLLIAKSVRKKMGPWPAGRETIFKPESV